MAGLGETPESAEMPKVVETSPKLADMPKALKVVETSPELAETPKAVATSSVISKKLSYDLAFKLEVIEYAKTEKNNEAASRKYKIPPRRIREWKKQEEIIRQQITEGGPKAKKHKRLSGAGRKLTSTGLEVQLKEFFDAEREKNHRVTRKTLTKKAKSIFSELKQNGEISGDASLEVSRGYITRFVERNSLSIRRTTTTAQKPPEDYIPKIIEFVMFLRKIQEENSFRETEIYAADETAIWPDMGGKTCIAPIGSQDVPVQTTGHDKIRLTVFLCAQASGGKCKPFLLIPKKRPIPALDRQFGRKIHLVYCGKNWMDDALTKTFLHRSIGAFSFAPRLLVWDSYRCHISKEVKDELRRLNIKTAVIPGGCTKYIQAADVVWNAPFKAKFQELYDDWMANGNKEYTRGGNMKAPSLELICNWICESWKVVTPEMIKKSFKSCAVTTAFDGTEDDQIYFFKNIVPNRIEDLKNRNQERIQDKETGDGEQEQVDGGEQEQVDGEVEHTSDNEASDSDISIEFL